MRLLLIHSDYIEYEVKQKALKTAPDVDAAHKKGRMEEALCAFISVEAADEADVASSARKAAAEIKDVAGRVKAPRVMLYPYAHLSAQLSKKPGVAEAALGMIEKELAGMEVARSPFGWYKAFKISCKGHPLSELSRHVLPDGAVAPAGPAATASAGVEAAAPAAVASADKEKATETEALKAEKTLKSQWFVLTPEGRLVEADGFDFGPWPGLRKFYEYEAKGSRKAEREPAHIQLMQDLELVDYEPGSDAGNMRWFPKGQLIKRLLEAKVSEVCRRAGGLQIETPIMYDVAHPALNKYLQKFPARQYRIESEGREFFLRFAACFGMYLSMGRATLSYKHLPARIYELTHYSFRREQSGETSGIKRLRCFTMPDMHTLVADLDQAREEFKRQFDRSKEWMDSIGVPYETAVRFVRSFYDQNQAFAQSLAQTVKKPVLVEMWDKQNFYFVMKFEFNVNDTVHKAFALSTVQIDTQNPENFGITYAAADGSRKTPYLLHASLSGAIDRNLAAILETEAMKRDAGEKPALPFWLSPTQVRFIPVNDQFLPECLELAGAVNDAGLRADVDDSGGGIGKKIREAEKDWVPVIVVIGAKEAKSGVYEPRLRRPEYAARAGVRPEEGEALALQWPALLSLLEANQGDEPRAPLPVHVHLSQRPIFRG